MAVKHWMDGSCPLAHTKVSDIFQKSVFVTTMFRNSTCIQSIVCNLDTVLEFIHTFHTHPAALAAKSKETFHQSGFAENKLFTKITVISTDGSL